MSRKALVPIQLPADPTQALEAATKQYADGLIFSGPSDPIGTTPQCELWYDDDDPGLGDMSKLPRGWIGQGINSADQGSITTAVDVTGLSVAWTADPTRRYLVTAVLQIFGTATGTATITLVNAAGGLVHRKATSIPGASTSVIVTLINVETGLSGATTRKIQAAVSAGTLTVNGASSYNAWLLVQDIGGV